jgi:hypothetical protein
VAGVSEPYYADESVTLFHGDCREITEWLSADVLVTDPPYGVAYVSGQRSVKSAPIVGDSSLEVRNCALSAWGTSRPALVFGTWRVPAPAGEVQRLVWWKRGGGVGMGNLAMPWGTKHEEIYVLGTGWDRCTAGVTRQPSVLVTSATMGGSEGVVSRAEHPTAKPVGLLSRLIEACPPGTVGDPFAGSGSTLLAARSQGRRSIGVEIEERYCEVIAKRLAQADLFGGAA